MSDFFNQLQMSLADYLKKLGSEKEYLCAAFLQQTGLQPSDVVIVQRIATESEGGTRFYLTAKDWHTDVEAPVAETIRSLRARNAMLENVAEAAKEMIDLVNMPSIPIGMTIMEAWGSKLPSLEEALAALEAVKVIAASDDMGTPGTARWHTNALAAPVLARRLLVVEEQLSTAVEALERIAVSHGIERAEDALAKIQALREEGK